MFKRLAVCVTLLLAFMAAGIVIQACRGSAAPAPLALPGTPFLAAPNAGAPVWILDQGGLNSNRLVALDPTYGETLAVIEPQADSQVTSGDGRRRYTAGIALQDGRWLVELTTIDLLRGAITRVSPLADFSLMLPANPGDLSMQLALSPDDRLLAVTLSSRLDSRWYSDLFLYDTVTETSLRPAPLQPFNENIKDQPSVLTIVSSDGRRVFLVEDRQRAPSAAAGTVPLWSTTIAVVNVEKQEIEQTIAAPGEIQSDGFWTSAFLSPDGGMLYLMQTIVRGNDQAGHRFVALDTNTLGIVRTLEVYGPTSGAPPQAESFCGSAYGSLPRFTPDGRYLVGFCGGPEEHFQFLDTQTGSVAQTAVVDHSAEPAGQQNFESALFASPGGAQLYLVHLSSRAVYVLDAAGRAVVRRAVLHDPGTTGWDPGQWLAGLLVPTASAKFYPQPAAVISADGQRLYFVGVKDFETGDGVWGVETATLRPLGHWLAHTNVVGVGLSANGDELYAVSQKDHTLYILDALTGQPRRSFDKNLTEPWGLVQDR